MVMVSEMCDVSEPLNLTEFPMSRDRAPAVHQQGGAAGWNSHDYIPDESDAPWSSVLLADPQAALCQLLVERLRAEFPSLEIAHATTIQDARDHLSRQSRTLILSAVRFPDGGVWDLAGFLEASATESRIVFWSDQELPFLSRQCASVALGKRCLRSWSVEQLVREIGTLVENDSGAGSRSGLSTAQSSVVEPLVLSARQKAVMILLAQGLAVKQVAAQLQRSVKTVDSLKFRLMRTLGLHDRVELTRLAIREGLIDP